MSPTVLQNGDWEVIGGVAGEPEAELLVCVVGGDHLLTDLLQLRHPAGGQMAVLQHHPRTLLDRLRDHVGCNWTL